jgi:polyhydroxybutyrate depolymerase
MNTDRFIAARLASVLLLVLGCLGPTAMAQPAEVPRANAGTKVQWITPEVRAPRVSFHTFESAAAKATVSYHLYTPAAYAGAAGKGFPVVYWLHGSGGGAAGIAKVAAHFDAAIEAGKTPPCLVVFVNGLVEGMYVDWKDGTAPLESVIVKDLVPHIDAAYRTIATRQGRMLDGFSMGGYGSARLGFKFPEMFRAVSIVGAGPMQAELIQAPRAGRKRAAEVLAKVYGGDQAYFRAVSPRVLAEENAEAITKGSLVRVVIGDKDETFAPNKAFHEHLERLKIPHTWTVLPGVAHDPMGVLSAMGDDNWAFYRAAFGEPQSPAAKAPVATTKPAAPARPALAPGKAITRSIKVGTLDRRSLVYIPRGYDAARPTPVVVVFHGGGGNPETMVNFSGLNDKADEAVFIVAYPYGTGRLPNRLLTFNGGNCCGYAMDNNIDDVGFTRAMLDDLASVANVDANRVYATGMSNGGIMAYRVASELADRFAAIAPVGGPMGTETCKPSRPVAVMHFHGTADAQAPFNGGQGKGNALTNVRPVFLSVQHSLDQWIKANGCAQPPEVVQLPDAAADGMTVTRKTWGGGKDGTEVVLIEITGGGHTWPGREPPLEMLGPSTKDISANDLMWEFFQRHTRSVAEAKPEAKPPGQ